MLSEKIHLVFSQILLPKILFNLIEQHNYDFSIKSFDIERFNKFPKELENMKQSQFKHKIIVKN